MLWPTARLHPLPDELSDADGAMLEPLGVALHALDLGHHWLGMTVGVLGCGPISLLLVQLARRAGARTVIATDLLPHRQRAAADLGAEVVEASGASLAALGVDVAFEVAGTDAGVEAAMLAARPGARVVLVGIPDATPPRSRRPWPAARA